MIAASPFSPASESGVKPSRLATFGFAPACSNRLVSTGSARYPPSAVRCAVSLRRAHVGLLRQQDAHRRGVPAHHGVGHITAGGTQAGHRLEGQQQRHGATSNKVSHRHRCPHYRRA